MSQSQKQQEYRLARQMQDLFRDAVKSVMDGNLTELEAVVQRFLESHHGSSVEEMIRDFHSEGKTLLHIAASSGKYFVMEHLLAYCSTVPLKTVLEENPNELVISSGDANNLQNLKKLVNIKDDRGFTLLMNATVSENEEMMKLLLRLGADVNARNEDGAAAVHFAAGDGSVSRLKLLSQYGSKFDTQSKSGTPLHWAAGKGRNNAIKFILEHGNGDVNAISAEGLPPVLMAAVASADLGVKHLVEAGADIGMIVSGNLTTLHICAEHGLLEAVKAIIATETGLKCCNIETSEGNTPLHLAAMAGHSEIVRVLLPYTTTPSEVDGKSEDEKVDYFLEDGKRRMREWETLHQAKEEAAKQQAAAAAAVANPGASAEADSSARFDAITCPEKTADIEAQAEKQKDKANTLYKAGKFAEAIESYSAAIALDKMNAVYWSNRSACYLTMKENRQALLDAEVCRRLKPDWPKGCYRLAAARLAMGFYEDAAVAAFEGCKLDSTNEELKAIMQKAVRKGQEEHKKKLAATEK